MYTKFQCPTMPGTGLKVFVGGGMVVGVYTYYSFQLSSTLTIPSLHFEYSLHSDRKFMDFLDIISIIVSNFLMASYMK